MQLLDNLHQSHLEFRLSGHVFLQQRGIPVAKERVRDNLHGKIILPTEFDDVKSRLAKHSPTDEIFRREIGRIFRRRRRRVVVVHIVVANHFDRNCSRMVTANEICGEQI